VEFAAVIHHLWNFIGKIDIDENSILHTHSFRRYHFAEYFKIARDERFDNKRLSIAEDTRIA